MKKRYCKNCRYYEPENWWGYEEGWYFDKCYSREGKIYQEYVGKLEQDLIRNKDNCPHYKPKWWKFWVK